ncbi:MAG: asparagine synthase (glutamine-hydrolyzing) [Verrucomicrobiales bacterium]|nr:asparagine synthase (glutamine-hydrolyzing) [Verrucomicrobiales bacterium]|tara:strand:+ start:4859 stop:6652 length:1794 start_codon:yes stop_codon:yes gene_type:complete
MCGIAGIFTPSPRESELLSSMAVQMQDKMRHRGPDGDGRWISPSERAVLVHTRLAIIGLGEAGQQPKTQGANALTFNGEIYNYRTLRSELESAGININTPTDSEVLLASLIHNGSACLQKLRGMFAFAFWDEAKKEGRLVRDPLGIKPLYYYQASDGSLYFASELRALLASGNVPRNLSARGIYGFLRMGTVPEPDTMIEGVRLLRAGSQLLWKDGKVTEEQYWSIPSASDGANEDDVSEALQDTVKHHFESDVPVGIFLSGGKDSASILSLARQIGVKDIKTYSVGNDDPAVDESDLAREVGAHFQTEHIELKLEGNIVAKWLDEFLSAVDQPTNDGFNTWVVSRMAHEAGAKVVLSGLGGDEIFGGYPSFQMVPKLVRNSRRIRWLGGLAGTAARCLGRLRNDSRFTRLGEFLSGRPTVRRAYTALRGAFTHREACRIGQSLGLSFTEKNAEELDRGIDSPENESGVSEQELTRYLRNQLLRDSDVMSMSHSLELRVPFIDRAFVEEISNVRPAIRYQPGKQALVDGVGDLPNCLLNVPKRGFALPFRKWLDGALKERISKLDRFQGVSLNTWYRQWSLMVLLDWIERHVEQSRG